MPLAGDSDLTLIAMLAEPPGAAPDEAGQPPDKPITLHVAAEPARGAPQVSLLCPCTFCVYPIFVYILRCDLYRCSMTCVEFAVNAQASVLNLARPTAVRVKLECWIASAVHCVISVLSTLQGQQNLATARGCFDVGQLDELIAALPAADGDAAAVAVRKLTPSSL